MLCVYSVFTLTHAHAQYVCVCVCVCVCVRGETIWINEEIFAKNLPLFSVMGCVSESDLLIASIILGSMYRESLGEIIKLNTLLITKIKFLLTFLSALLSEKMNQGGTP